MLPGDRQRTTSERPPRRRRLIAEERARFRVGLLSLEDALLTSGAAEESVITIQALDRTVIPVAAEAWRRVAIAEVSDRHEIPESTVELDDYVFEAAVCKDPDRFGLGREGLRLRG